MDSITHALYKAVSAEDAAQRLSAYRDREDDPLGAAVPNDAGAGLQSLSVRPRPHSGPGAAACSDLHISLGRSPETLALWLELTAVGLSPPVGMIEDGADVFFGPGYVDINSPVDTGKGIWVGMLCPGSSSRRAEWKQELV